VIQRTSLLKTLLYTGVSMRSTEITEEQRIPLNQITSEIIGAAMRVHAHLGPGLLENTYLGCLEHELRLGRFNVRTQVYLPVEYKGVKVKLAYGLDMIVNDAVINGRRVMDSIRFARPNYSRILS
jgi:GxxExxY protein